MTDFSLASAMTDYIALFCEDCRDNDEYGEVDRWDTYLSGSIDIRVIKLAMADHLELEHGN